MKSTHPTAFIVALLLVGLSGTWWLLRRNQPAGTGVPEASASAPPGTLPPRDSPIDPEAFRRARPGMAPMAPTQAVAGVEAVDVEAPDISPAHAERTRRDLNVRLTLESPARNSPEFRGIAALCERFGLAPWAVSVAYNLAYERAVQDRSRRKFAAEGVPPPPPEVLEAEAVNFAAQVDRLLGDPQTPVDPRFAEALQGFLPEVFIGPFIGAPGNGELLDGMDWPTWHARIRGEPPP